MAKTAKFAYFQRTLYFFCTRFHYRYIYGTYFQPQIYGKLLEWKVTQNDKSIILVESARHVDKSTLVESFAKNEYESYLFIDSNKASPEVKELFKDLMDLDYIFHTASVDILCRFEGETFGNCF